ncbi:hypothetical protein AD998_07095 [bacterium 336/3]|nr:hypothetical protein AD998_07095 [bacterium 336/3]
MNQSSINIEARTVLIQLIDSINQLTYDEYTQKIGLLSNATIGEHTRHIIELFQQLLVGYESKNINYDKRKRDIHIQENVDFAIECIANVIQNLEKDNKTLYLTTLYNNQDIITITNYHRELMYNIEHCIHHQAIIKIAFLYFEKTNIDENFGVAKSTIEYREQGIQ